MNLTSLVIRELLITSIMDTNTPTKMAKMEKRTRHVLARVWRLVQGCRLLGQPAGPRAAVSPERHTAAPRPGASTPVMQAGEANRRAPTPHSVPCSPGRRVPKEKLPSVPHSRRTRKCAWEVPTTTY